MAAPTMVVQAPVVQQAPVQATAAMLMQPAVPVAASVPQANFVASSVQTTSRRDRLAFGLDWIRIPFPILRIFAIPGPERVVTETQLAPVPQPTVAVGET